MLALPFSKACENNKQVIWSVICRFFCADDLILEIATGTAQHCKYFLAQRSELRWQTSDIKSSLAVVEAGLQDCEIENILKPLILDVQQDAWPVTEVDGVFSANSLHIMSLAAVEDFFSGVGRVLKAGGYLCVYGPFKYNQEFTTDSNANFDLWLKDRDFESGIRDFEKVTALAKLAGLRLLEDNKMPANNQLVVWQKK